MRLFLIISLLDGGTGLDVTLVYTWLMPLYTFFALSDFSGIPAWHELMAKTSNGSFGCSCICAARRPCPRNCRPSV